MWWSSHKAGEAISNVLEGGALAPAQVNWWGEPGSQEKRIFLFLIYLFVKNLEKVDLFPPINYFVNILSFHLFFSNHSLDFGVQSPVKLQIIV